MEGGRECCGEVGGGGGGYCGEMGGWRGGVSIGGARNTLSLMQHEQETHTLSLMQLGPRR